VVGGRVVGGRVVRAIRAALCNRRRPLLRRRSWMGAIGGRC